MRLYIFVFLFMIHLSGFSGTFFQSDDDLFYSDIKDCSSEDISGVDNVSLNGQVNIGDNFLPEGTAFLMSASKGGVSIWRKKIIEGNFRINNLRVGKYRLFVIPATDYSFNYFPNYLPTYYGNTYQWNSSKLIEIHSDNLDIKFNLLSYAEPFYGHYSISGEIFYNNVSKIHKDLPIVIYLMNEDRALMDFRIVNEVSGKYQFNNLPEGNYFIYPESPGVYSPGHQVLINNQTFQNRVNFIAQNNSIELERDDIEVSTISDRNSCIVLLSKQINEPIVCELFNIAGTSVLKKVYYDNSINMNTGGLCAGIYILKITTYSNKFIETKKVYINNN